MSKVPTNREFLAIRCMLTTAKVFSMLNELAVEAVRVRKEQITDEDVESWEPALEREAVFA